jgi:hypothetical protein
MSNTALQHDWFEPPETPRLALVANVAAPIEHTTDSLLVATTLSLITLQILDGILTSYGLMTFGPHAEGNPLLASLMNQIGILPALILAKTFCISLVIFLHIQAKSMTWIKHALLGISCWYVFSAVLPWSYLLAQELL